jgi:3-deoxy-manno-octulosonate cytidylyltransferase (CMP-KDO synthetase)
VLPARYASTRFPGKPLATIAGKLLIEWAYEGASRVRGASRVLVATDDDRIAAAVRGFGGDVVMTRGSHESGTDRVAEVARTLRASVVVNLQGDEPVFDPGMVEEMVGLLAREPEVEIVTACHPIQDTESLQSPHVVKVVVDRRGRALYFSRAPIPSGALFDGARALRHVGVYAFRREALQKFTRLPRTPLEIAERLEQLRALEHGMVIAVVETRHATVGVDVPADIKNVERFVEESLDSTRGPRTSSARK